MPDSNRLDPTRPFPPVDWTDAFAQLPLEEPALSVWPSVRALVRATNAPVRRQRTLAMAASLGFVLLLTLIARRVEPVPTPAPALAAVAPADPSPRSPVAPPTPDAGVAARIQHVEGRVAAARPAPAARTAAPRPFDPARPLAKRALARPGRLDATARREASPIRAGADEMLELAALQAESGQLEQLLLLARTEEVASGMSILVADVQLDRIEQIDLALQSPIDAGERVRLWRGRVDALREATAFEGSRRWRGAQGMALDAALVRVD